MIYSKSSQYAIRAVTNLAQSPPGTLCRLEEIAQGEDIPQPFLAKIMQRLTKKRLIRSLKGKKGGYALLIPAEEITLYTIVDAMDDLSLSLSDCILGRGNCSEEQHCPLHESWKELRKKQVDFLQVMTISDMVAAIKKAKHNGNETENVDLFFGGPKP